MERISGKVLYSLDDRGLPPQQFGRFFDAETGHLVRLSTRYWHFAALLLTKNEDLVEELLRSRRMIAVYPEGRCRGVMVALCPRERPYYATIREFFADFADLIESLCEFALYAEPTPDTDVWLDDV